MISYNPKDWIRFVFRFHKTDTLRQLFPLIVGMGIFSWAIVFFEANYLRLSSSIYAKNITTMHSLLGFAISMLLVFRTNTAYDRWWEGRKLWGSLVNNSRNLAIKMNSLLAREDEKNRSFFKKIIPLFAFELKNHLQNETTRLELDISPHPEISGFDSSKHVPNQIVAVLFNKVHLLKRDGIISDYELLFINHELQSFMDICGACERIKNTPIPYSYSAFIKKFIFLYIITLPLGFALTLGYFTIPATLFISYVLTSLELIAEEIEDPFGNDDNDLPMEKIAANIQKNIQDILA